MLGNKILFFQKKLLFFFFPIFFPYFLTQFLPINFETLLICFIPYFVYLMWNWVLIGKEVGHRLKIYTRANSGMERVTERLVLGVSIIVVVSSFLSLLQNHLQNKALMVLWIIWGVWNSWPTRKKLFEAKISSEFGEFKFLDGFERTVLALFLIFFFVSIPELPTFRGMDAMRLYIDPLDNIHIQFWKFLNFSLAPFRIFGAIKLKILGLFSYLLSFTLCFLALYSLFRYQFSRRLSLLGLLAFISTWSFSLILEDSFSFCFSTTVTILWIWSTMWAINSFSYRSGFVVGLVQYCLVLISPQAFFLGLFQFPLIAYYFRTFKSVWYLKQFLKYSLFGVLASFLTYLTHNNNELSLSFFELQDFLAEVSKIFFRKSLYLISLLGIVILMFKKNLNKEMREIILTWFVFFLASIFIYPHWLDGFTVVFTLVFLSLIPLDEIFQNLNNMRSRRNLIFGIYILICLLDSHLEGRVKIALKNLM
jgi:hypothetical protein